MQMRSKLDKLDSGRSGHYKSNSRNEIGKKTVRSSVNIKTKNGYLFTTGKD